MPEPQPLDPPAVPNLPMPHPLPAPPPSAGQAGQVGQVGQAGAAGLSARDRRAMVAILLAVGLATLGTAITNTALPAIAADLHASPAASIWIINAYQVETVATLLPFAALGDRFGPRRIYLGGLVFFTFASLACALAGGLPSVAGARVLQGIGAGALMSVNIALACAAPALPRSVPAGHGFDPRSALLTALTFAMLMLALTAAAQRQGLLLVLLGLALALNLGRLLRRRQAGHSALMLPEQRTALGALTAAPRNSMQRGAPGRQQQ